MNKTLKIAIYSGEIPSTTFIERLIKGLSSKENLKVYLFGIKQKKINYPRRVVDCSYKNNRFYKLMYLTKYWFLLSIFKSKSKQKLNVYLKSTGKYNLYSLVKAYPVLWHRPDIFHIQWAKGLGEWMWVQDFGIKIVLSFRGAHINYSPLANPELSQMYKSTFPKINGFHAVSLDIAKEATKYNASFDKTHVIYSALDFRPYSENITSPSKNNFRIISVGRPHWKKGYTYSLDACYKLKQNGFKFNYKIIGGDKSIELQYQVKDLGLEEEISLLGKLTNSEVINEIQNSNLLLLPSVEEGIANVVLEAMAIGTPVLTTDCGGMQEVITNGVNGFVSSSRNSTEMAENIIQISNLSDKHLEEIVNNAKQTILNNHQMETMINEMESLYVKVFNNVS